MRKSLKIKGFTMIEILIVIAIIGILATVMVIGLNPGRQLAKARDTQRETDVYSILALVYQFGVEHSGALPDTDGDQATSNFPTSLTCIGTDPGCFNLANAGDVSGDKMVPDYTAQLPKDPKIGNDGNIGYTIMVDANNHLVASASGETRTITATK